MAGIDVYMAFQFVKRLTTPFEQTEAFKLGLIDKNGISVKKPQTADEKNAYSLFDRVIFNIKRLIAKAPGGESKIANIAAAMYLMKEQDNLHNKVPTDSELWFNITQIQKNITEQLVHDIDYLIEDEGGGTPANATGSAVVGTGNDPVHWGKRQAGRPRQVGRYINAVQYLKRRTKTNAHSSGTNKGNTSS